MTDIMTIHEPPGWRLYRLGQLFDERKEKVSDKDYPPLSVTMNGIVPQLETAAKSDDGDNRKLVKAGDYVLNSRSDRKGSGGISPHDGSVSLISIVMRPKGVYPRFAHHLLRSRAFQEEFYRWGHGIVADLWTTRYSDMKNIRLFLPDLDTQKSIANFLDRETARIDRLIEKKKRLAELLAEKVQIQVNEVLDGYSHSIKPQSLRWLVRVRSGDFISNVAVEKSPTDENRYPVVGGNGIMAYTAIDNAPPQTIVVGRVGALCGNVHFVEQPSWVTDNALIVRIISPKVEPGFLVALLRAANLNEKASKSAQPLITGETVKSLKVRVPSRSVQLDICRKIAILSEDCANLSSLVVKSAERLKEYRSALIAAAVTGQIDVMTWGKQGGTDRCLDQIEEDMALREARA
ncbi:restriction endonuclease subunit S [Hyphococcus sp.]|uniref:restriction endonuclease subunit S n=1 Tax=Hyphococcus sp. TaxID=2038636 RepID=UPI0035C68A3D